MIGEDDRLGALVDALLLVAAEPDDQARALGVFRGIAEQIRNGVEETGLLDQQLVEEGILPENVGSVIREIDETFDRLLDADALSPWTEEALRGDDTWRRLRQLSRAALRTLGVDWRRSGFRSRR